MAVFHAFRALRPTPEKAADVAALPYDVVDRAEAKAIGDKNPDSFLHVDRAEMDLPDDTKPLRKSACRMLKALAMQSWTQPLRNNEMDRDIVRVERFRHHVWWVGGNALAYRPLLETAVLMDSIPMVDVVAEVAKRSLSNVSQTTYNEAFWNEGFTADGAGWGHGVGLCQIGAAVMGEQGYKYEEILSHYYPGSTLEKQYQ